MAFRDLSEVLDAGLSLPVNGKTYLVPPVDAETGLRLQRLAELPAQTAKVVEDGEALDGIVLDDATRLICTGMRSAPLRADDRRQ